jgi:competence protein ComEA
MKPLGWMMNERRVNDSKGEFFLLLFIILALYVMKGSLSLSSPGRIVHEEKVFVRISGNITRPGIYGFSQSPTLKNLVARAGGLLSETEKDLSSEGILYDSGSDIEVVRDENEYRVFSGEMSAFYKITLGIPISLNRESLDGLTAIRGIGPGIASAIVYERARRGGFKSLDELMSVPGIGRKLYIKVSPYLVL